MQRRSTTRLRARVSFFCSRCPVGSAGLGVAGVALALPTGQRLQKMRLQENHRDHDGNNSVTKVVAATARQRIRKYTKPPKRNFAVLKNQPCP